MRTTGKRPRTTLSLPLTIVVFISAIVFLFYIDSFFSSSTLLRFKPCSKGSPLTSTKFTKDGKKEDEDYVINYEARDRIDFDPNKCMAERGMWVRNTSYKPLYTDGSCPYISRQTSCSVNGRPDTDYRYWEWQLDDCILPRFDPEIALTIIRGKRLMFVGDSVIKGQWESFVCMVQTIVPDGKKLMRRGKPLSVFTLKEYNATIEYYWTPFLVESNCDEGYMPDPFERMVKIDNVTKHSKHWVGVDILVFDSYVWWMSTPKIKSLWGSFANAEQGSENLDVYVSYRLGLKTWANWVDSTIDPKKTRVFFTTPIPIHRRSLDWNKEGGLQCFNETEPIMKRGHWGSGSDKQIIGTLIDIVRQMRVPVTLINVTQMSDYRKDAHSSIYSEMGGSLLTEEQKEDPATFADCIHWCLPGVPDTWNQVFLAYLKFQRQMN